eukprot:jgi/Chrpa1/219/Chrysochromulina_OHIO_Genome00013777-RA
MSSNVGSADVREPSTKTQELDGEAVPLALRLVFKPSLLAAATRPRPPTRLRPLLYDLSLDERSERSGRSDMLRGPFDRSDGPTTAVYLRRQVRSSNPRAAIGFEALPQGTAVGKEAPRRSSLIIGSQWTISCWVQLPLPPRHGRDSIRRCDWVLAMGLGTQSAPGAPAEGGAAPVLPVCHVAFVEDYEGAAIDGRPAVRLAVEWDAPPGTERVVCLDRFDLQSLPHGWHSIAAVGIPGSTTFYVDGRRRGAVPEMVSAPIVWLGNCFASDGRPDAAVGGLSDLRVYTTALTAHMVAALDASAGHCLGGLDVFDCGVWGDAGPPPAHVFEHNPWEGAVTGRPKYRPLAPTTALGAPLVGSGGGGGGSGRASAASAASGTYWEEDDEGDEWGGDEVEVEWDEVAEVATPQAAAAAAALDHPKPRLPSAPKTAPKRPCSTDKLESGMAGAQAALAEQKAAQEAGLGEALSGREFVQSSSALVATGSTSTALVSLAGASPAKKRSRLQPYPLRQPALDELEREDMASRREHMEKNGYSVVPGGQDVLDLDPRIAKSLWPKELWERPRERGTMHRDTYLLCHLCTEAALLRDPHIKLTPYWCKVGACPPGFVSRPDLERHLRSQHCLPDDTAAPRASLTYTGDATLAASIPLDAAASAASDASAARMSSRQFSLFTAKAKREEEEPLLASRWGQPGVGDGVIDVTVRRVRPISGSRFIVEGTCQDGTLTKDTFTKNQLQVLRRTIPVLPGLDNDVVEGQEEEPAEAKAALMGDTAV